MKPETPDRFGALKADRRIVSDPVGDLSADEWNRVRDFLSQLSLGGPSRMWVRFPTSTTATLPAVITPIDGSAEWGDGSGAWPTVVKTATGIYTVTALASAPVPGAWTNSVHETETVSFRRSRGEIEGPITAGAAGYVRTDRSAHVITVYVYNSNWILSDLVDGTPITVEAG